jgi:hypothetical protein
MGPMVMKADNYPFVKEFLTDNQGQIQKVVLQLDDYQRLIEALEDEGLYRAMQAVKDEQPLSLEEALKEMNRP